MVGANFAAPASRWHVRRHPTPGFKERPIEPVESVLADLAEELLHFLKLALRAELQGVEMPLWADCSSNNTRTSVFCSTTDGRGRTARSPPSYVYLLLHTMARLFARRAFAQIEPKL